MERFSTMLVCTLALVSVWLATRPYEGFTRDAQLYLVQALHRLEPNRYAEDLFFRYGSQDRFSVFPTLYSWAVKGFGAGHAHVLMALLGQVLWLAALTTLVRVILPRGMRFLSMFAACAMVPVYIGGALQYGEPYVTPRLFVEALSMLAIAGAVARRRIAALVLLLVAFALHPIMTLPAALLVLVVVAPPLRLVAPVAFAAAMAAVAAGWMGIDPFARLFVRIDPEWAALVEARTQAAFVGNWFWKSVVGLTLPAVLIGVVACRGQPLHRSLARLALILPIALTVTSYLGADLGSNLLILNLQLPRGLWLLLLLANCFAPLAYSLLPALGRSRAILLLAVAANIFEAQFGLGTVPFVSATLGLALASALTLERAEGRLDGPISRWVFAGFAAVATLFWMGQIAALVLNSPPEQQLDFLLAVLVISGAAVLGLVATGRLAYARPVLCLIVPVVLVAAIATDRRTEEMSFLTGNAPIPAVFKQQLAGRTVYWEGGLELLWFGLRQPSYFSCYQSAGSMFFRATAIEHDRRAKVLRTLNTSDFWLNDGFCHQRPDAGYIGPRSVAQLRTVCKALPELDALVLRADFPDASVARWIPDFRVAASGFALKGLDGEDRTKDSDRKGGFSLYLCDSLRD